jgi:hypothetical protein
MAMVCSQCRGVFEQRLNCPDCGVRLLFQARLGQANNLGTPAPSEWQQTPWGRMAIGLVLAQGLGYGMQHMLTAGILISGEESSVWATLLGIVLLHGIQGLSLIVGGALCGAGRDRGIVYGSLIGLVNGLIFLFVQRQSGEAMTDLALYGQPLLHLAFGALGGLIGTWIWRPLPTIALEDSPVDKAPKRFGSSFQLLAGPVHLGRVFTGVFIVVAGVVWSNAILEWVLNASQGALAIKTHLQAQLVGWEISALTILLGAGLAGATTFNGLKQGLCVGLGAGVVLAGIQLGNPRAALEATTLMIASILALACVGGWFGCQLFPPVGSGKRRSRLLTD